jgi:hypothetical protein
MNIPFFVFCVVAFAVTVSIDTFTKTRSQEKQK